VAKNVNDLYVIKKIKSKAIPVIGRGDLQGCKMLRIPCETTYLADKKTRSSTFQQCAQQATNKFFHHVLLGNFSLDRTGSLEAHEETLNNPRTKLPHSAKMLSENKSLKI
jgi:hypothetical protein